MPKNANLGNYLQAQTQDITLQVILRAVFGVKDSYRFERMRALLGAILDTFSLSFGFSLLFFKVLLQDLWSISFLFQIRQ